MPIADWNKVDWRTTVVLLTDPTMGIPLVPLNRQTYPQFGRSYFMMAATPTVAGNMNITLTGYPDPNTRVILYNAAEVGTAGRNTSEFVFMHEVGHFILGHVHQGTAVAVDPNLTQQPTFPAGNIELQADWYSFVYWITQPGGLDVIEAAYDYLHQNGDGGDATHPPGGQRAAHLFGLLDSRTWRFRIYNDNTTPLNVVTDLLTFFGLDALRTQQVIADAQGPNQFADVPALYRHAQARPLLAAIRQRLRELGVPLRIDMLMGQ